MANLISETTGSILTIKKKEYEHPKFNTVMYSRSVLTQSYPGDDSGNTPGAHGRGEPVSPIGNGGNVDY